MWPRASVLLARRGRAGCCLAVAGVAASGLAGFALSAPPQCQVESRHFCLRVEVLSPDPVNPVRLMVIDHLAHGIGAAQMPMTQFTEHTAMLDALARLRAPRPEFTSFHIGGGTYSVPRAFATRGTGPITVAEIDPAVTRWPWSQAKSSWHSSSASTSASTSASVL
jgi:hypothetical protein